MAEHHGVSTSAMAAQYRDSRTTPTTRPKIKIIHIIAPKIIKTDVANFRELVQRLTGKQPAAGASSAVDTARLVQEEEKAEVVKKRPPPAAATALQPNKKRKIKCEVKVEEGGFGDYNNLDRGDLWLDLNPGGFLSFLEDDDVFQGLLAADHDFLQLPLGSSRLDLVGQMYAS